MCPSLATKNWDRKTLSTVKDKDGRRPGDRPVVGRRLGASVSPADEGPGDAKTSRSLEEQLSQVQRINWQAIE